MPCFFGTAIFFAVSGAIACGSEENPGRWFCRSGNLPDFCSSETAISETAVSELQKSVYEIFRQNGRDCHAA